MFHVFSSVYADVRSQYNVSTLKHSFVEDFFMIGAIF